jgi:hypothetical protein
MMLETVLSSSCFEEVFKNSKNFDAGMNGIKAFIRQSFDWGTTG